MARQVAGVHGSYFTVYTSVRNRVYIMSRRVIFIDRSVTEAPRNR